MRPTVMLLILLYLVGQPSMLHAQWPFGPAVPLAGVRFRPAMPPVPPIPVPGVYRPHPGYLRVPGAAVIPPGFVAPASPSLGYRYSAVVVLPVPPVGAVPSYSAGPIALAQPASGVSSMRRESAANSPNRPSGSSSSNDTLISGELRAGMVLPDGAVVVSVGQPQSSGDAKGSTQSSASLAIEPTPAPANNPASGVLAPSQSILDREVLPRPSSSDLPDKRTDKSTKSF